MDRLVMDGRTHTLGPRIPMNAGPLETFEAPTPVWGMNIASRIIRRAEETCTSENANMCEKPVGSRTPTIAIILGIVIPVVGITFVLLYLHRKNVAKFKKEDQDDPHKELDFGLDKNPGVKAGLRRSIFGVGEKAAHKHQLSMDMDMSTPYLLPPQLQTSRESLHSLARSIKNTEDPYRPVQYAGSDVGSLRSVQRGPGGEMASLYSASTRSGGTRDFGPNRQNSLPRPAPAADPFQRKPMPSADGSMSPTSIMSSDAFRPARGSALGRKPSAPYPDEKFAMNEPDVVEMPDSQPRALGSPTPPKLDVALPAPDTQTPLPGQFASPMSATIETAEPAAPANYHGGFDFGDANAPRGMSAGDEFIGTAHSSPPPQQVNLYEGAHQPQESFVADGNHGYDNYNSTQDYHQEGPMDYEFEPRGRTAHRDSQRGSQFLAAPNTDNKRLSVGFRPLPPDEIMETEDPEHRANRIRSFYKEYFDDQAPASHPPVPEIPPQAAERRAVPPGPPPQRAQTNEYYEDYDGAYLENTFFDPGSNTFVMPYAQPVHRRAMTPPPRAPRHRGPPPPRGVHGSIGGMSMASSRPPFRPGSSASSRYGPRPGSSASARLGNRGKPMPPPASLTTLPNPAKLRDDSFALFSATDFAPPDTIKDHAAGRSQSPAPEKRPYALNVPVHNPLVSSYDELPVIPSPHMLRKSSTFTGLDFAPPRRFKDNGDTMSDSGSIRSYRSNKSGISAMNNAAIRNGAGRVSRLPGDTVFTQAQLADQLKPSWTLRP